MECLNDNDFLFIERFLLSFKELGGKSDGLIDYEMFKSHIYEKGDVLKETLSIINEEECVKEKNLDYFQLCASILATKSAFNSMSLENGRVRDTSIPINTRTYTRKKNIPTSLDEKQVNTEVFTQQMNGSVYHVNEDFYSNWYHMEILENSCIEMYVDSQGDLETNVPFEILVFQEKSKVLLTSSSLWNSEGCSTLKYHFKKGKYTVVPVLLNWPHSEPPSRESVNLSSLIDLDDDGHVVLTEACERAMKKVFDTIDLDKNGLLSQLEFDLFIQYTSGETAADEWSAIEDNFKMEDHELTFEGFLELYKMVLQTDPSDVTTMFCLMGMNEKLEQQYAQHLTLFLRVDSSRFLLSPLPIASYAAAAEKGFCKVAVEQGFSKKVKNMNDLMVYTLRLPQRATIVLQNQSHSKVKVRLDCRASSNCKSHRNSLDYTVEVPPRTSIVGHHLIRIDPKEDWNFECLEELK